MVANAGDISLLNRFAEILIDEPKEYISLLNHELENGISYPKARENALLMYLNDIRKYANILSGSNNILGIEYLKAIIKLKSKITPITIKRIGTDYNSTKVNDSFASATAIRQMLTNGSDLKSLMPQESYSCLIENLKYGRIVESIYKFEKEIIYKLRIMSLKQISELQDVTEGLENRIKQAANSCNNINDLVGMIKSKRYTFNRIHRILIYSLLDITKKDMLLSNKVNPYIRILGFNNKGKILLSQLSTKNPNLNIVTSVKKFMDSSNNKYLRMMMQKDILASNIYTLGYEYDSKSNLDYTKKIIIT